METTMQGTLVSKAYTLAPTRSSVAILAVHQKVYLAFLCYVIVATSHPQHVLGRGSQLCINLSGRSVPATTKGA